MPSSVADLLLAVVPTLERGQYRCDIQELSTIQLTQAMLYDAERHMYVAFSWSHQDEQQAVSVSNLALHLLENALRQLELLELHPWDRIPVKLPDVEVIDVDFS